MMWYPQIQIMFALQFYIAAAILFFISLYAQSPIFVLMAFLLVMVNAIPALYLKKTYQNLHLLNPEQKIRVFSGKADTFSVTLENRGKLPVFNGKMMFGLEDAVWCSDLKHEGGSKVINKFSFRFNLLKKEKAVFPIKVKGRKRGVARVSAVNVETHDLLGVGTLSLRYEPFFRTEVIVYPELKAVSGVEKLKKFEMGTLPVQYSLFEDMTASMGTREYVSSDPFNRIHWKASAKSTNLQTKQYEKTTGMSWTLVLNMARQRFDVSVSSEALEHNISCLAYMAKYAASRGIPFEIYVNIKVRGKGSIMHLPAGEGREHLSKALEMLARINMNSVTVSQETMFAYVDRMMFRAPVMILFNCGKRKEEKSYIQKWERKGAALFEVNLKDESAYISSVSQKRKAIS